MTRRTCLGLLAQEVVPTFRSNLDLVNVLCTVRNAQGNLIGDLDRDQFTVKENGAVQQIRYFAHQADVPMTVALLLDVSGSVRQIVEKERATADKFLKGVIRPHDSVMLIGFSSSIVLWKTLEEVRDFPVRESTGGTLLYDAVYITAMQRLKNQTGSKAIVILSDGLDTGSQVVLKTAIRAAQANNIVVYSIFAIDSTNPSDVHTGKTTLRTLSRETGGEMIDLHSKASLDEVFTLIQNQLRSQYSIGYTSSNPVMDGTFRKLEIQVKRPGAVVLSRTGYYANKK